MKEPKVYHGKETLVYYKITMWPRGGGYGETIKAVYKTESAAVKRARVELAKPWKYTSATIRKEEVWARDIDCEFSSSGRVLEVYPI